MANTDNNITLDTNDSLRLESFKLPNGNPYLLGCTYQEAQTIYNTLQENIEAVNSDLEDLDSVVGIAKDTSTDKRTFQPTTNYGDDSTTVMTNMQKLDTKIKALEEENAALKQELKEFKELVEKQYMAYTPVSEDEGIIDGNIYTK